MSFPSVGASWLVKWGRTDPLGIGGFDILGRSRGMRGPSPVFGSGIRGLHPARRTGGMSTDHAGRVSDAHRRCSVRQPATGSPVPAFLQRPGRLNPRRPQARSGEHGCPTWGDVGRGRQEVDLTAQRSARHLSPPLRREVGDAAIVKIMGGWEDGSKIPHRVPRSVFLASANRQIHSHPPILPFLSGVNADAIEHG